MSRGRDRVEGGSVEGEGGGCFRKRGGVEGSVVSDTRKGKREGNVMETRRAVRW